MRHFILSILIAAWSFSVHGEEMRLVTLGVMPAETVMALDAADQLIGVDQSAAGYMAGRNNVHILNYHRTTSSEGVLSINPTHVIVTSAAGPPTAIQQIRAAGVKFLKVAEPLEWQDVVGGIQDLGEFIQRKAEAEVLVAALQQQKSQADAQVQEAQQQGTAAPRVLFVMSGSSGSLLCAGAESGADAVIRMAGGVNAATEFKGYKPISTEALIQLKPDIVIYPGAGGHAPASFGQILEEHPGLNQSPAAQNNRMHPIDLAATLGFGPSIGEAILTLVQWFYPETSNAVALHVN
ncbi:MAG: ABC transporter substrate-binding protein [Verrucomicrobiota bacterium]